MELASGLGLFRGTLALLSAGPVPPQAVGLLPDIALQRDVAMTPADLSSDFTGPGLGFALAPGSDALPDGLALSAGGVLSGTPTTNVTALTIVVRATNTEGSADSSFALSVQDVLLDFSATLTGLTANATHGPSAETGVPVTAVAAGFTAGSPASIAYQWKTQESGDIAGATGASHVPDAALYDGERLFCTITPAGYPAKNTAAAVIRQAPPQGAGTPGEQFWDIDTGPQAIDMSAFATGAQLAWSVTGQGAQIGAATGALSIRTESQAIGATALVRAENSGGAVTISFPFTIEDPLAGPGPELSVPILDDITNEIGIVTDEAGAVYWRLDPPRTNPDPGDVIAGGGLASGSFAVVAGANAADIVIPPGNAGWQEISFVAASDIDEPSLVRTAAIEIAAGSSQTAVIDTDFAAGFQTAEAALWASIQANAYNSVPVHRPAETWDGYSGTPTDGGVVGDKNGSYPQLRFSVPVTIGQTYTIDADIPVGEGTWTAALRLKIGSAIDLSDYAQLDESQTGQPRVVEIRGQEVVATSDRIWFAIIVQTSVSGGTGGEPSIAMLRIEEV